MPRFEWPWLLTGLPLLLLLVRRRARTALRLNLPAFAVPLTVRRRFLSLPAALRWTALVALGVALAGPYSAARPVREISRGIGIQMLVDRSGSMSAKDLSYRGHLRSRLDVVKQVAAEFIYGDHSLPGRPADMIGIIAFARDPVTLCPLTLAHEHLQPVLDALKPAAGEEDGTAVGDAVALAAARFQTAEAEAGSPFKSKIIILLTDGENNQGARSVDVAARLARNWGVRVYAVGIRPLHNEGSYEEIVQYGLETLATETGGIARRVEDGAALRAIFTEIDGLEKTGVHATHFTGGFDFPRALAFGVLCLLLAEAALSETWLRRIP